MAWLDLLRAVSLMLVIEGIMPFASPPRSRAVFARLATMDDRALRALGLLGMLAGVLGLQLIHWDALS
jgi:uncharacterized protein YjeT (DUF2065 family)